ncbi:hypothetical protein L208DRAFT_1448686 [Tricholoma matsutake]|nr:hypothetical protein L208DRAFT_1448686 [Tricholoma matsutake 945]
MSTAIPAPQPPQLPGFTILTRVAAIPMISSSLETINGALLSNNYTRSPYSTAKGLSTTAYKYTEPLQVRLAPLIIQADGYANMAVDVVQSRYPYPFTAKPEEVAMLASKTIDEKVKTPAFNVAQGIDQRFAPIVDYMEVAVTRLNSNSEAGPSTQPDSKYQYQRAFALSKSIFEYSNDQVKQLQAQFVIIQRATETAQSITQLASSSITSASTRIHSLSDTMLVELQKLQASTSAISASLQSQASQLQTQIPPQVQQTYAELSSSLSSAVTDFRAILTTKDLPLQEKVGRVGHEVQERVAPLLESFKKGISELLARGKQDVAAAAQAAPPEIDGVNSQPNGAKINGTHQYDSDSD